ncbi:TetR/AcrR family transcriptional regulator [Novosphingobium malaysiense]|uniref:TetR/AcrR family transcriptional regulator n=1 Tax=Novosphingobium malaysiense TaxID=1348853 RepID=UPI0012E03842|nr:TetR/AcrR family transcriptional regulator [Novosphingobium malaysiense]
MLATGGFVALPGADFRGQTVLTRDYDGSVLQYGPGEIALILAAERLMAEHGVLGVSLRQVNLAAGHRNLGAAHYHFGSREGLCRAVHRYRATAIDGRRSELLALATAADHELEVRFYVEAYVLPLADLLLPREMGCFYLRFLAQYHLSSMDVRPLQQTSPAAYFAAQKIEALLPYLPQGIRRARMRDLMHNAISALANVEHLANEGSLGEDEVSLIAANLVDTLTAALTCPISARTLHQIARMQGREFPSGFPKRNNRRASHSVF